MADERQFISYRRPWYRWYPKDWRSSPHVQEMSWARQAFYRQALDWAWELDGLPDDISAIRRLFKDLDVRCFRRHWAVISAMFPRDRDGKLRNKRQEIEREKMRRASEKASKSAESRWSKHPPSIPVSRSTQTQTHTVRTDPSINIGTSYIPPLSISGKPKAVKGREGNGEDRTVKAEPDAALHARAHRLLEEFYPQWYSAFRFGAKLPLVYGPLDFEHAVDLCRTWDDARLALLARIVLTTDEPWVSSTDRRFRIFWEKAGWADNRLATEEAKAREGGR